MAFVVQEKLALWLQVIITSTRAIKRKSNRFVFPTLPEVLFLVFQGSLKTASTATA